MSYGDIARLILVGLTMVSLITGFVWAIIKLVIKKIQQESDLRLNYETQFSKLDKTLAELTILQKSNSERLLRVEEGLNKLTDVIIEQRSLNDKVDGLVQDVAEIKNALNKKVDRDEWLQVCNERHKVK